MDQGIGNDMLRAFIAGLCWLTLYLLVIVAPILVFLAGNVPTPRSFWIEFGVMIGFALLVTMSLQFFLTARFRGVGRPFGTDTLLQLHRHVGILLVLFIVAHPLVLIINNPTYLEFFDPRVNLLRAVFLILASITMVLLIVLSVWRKSFKLNYEWWRLSHALMASGIVLVGLAHSWQVGHYVQGWKRVWLIAIGGSALASLVYVRLWRPYRMRNKRYRVKEIHDRRGEAATVVLEPDGHAGMNFQSGQYAWLSLGSSPFTLQQNPYSFSGSDQQAPQRLEFTAKVLGDFSKEFVDTAVGTTAFLEGPYGNFCLEDSPPGAVFIMGGIGVTPAISILRSLRDRDDQRPIYLFYGNTDWNEVAFRSELIKLEQALNLQVIHVINEPEDDWSGETGYITQEILERHLGERERAFPFFVCGPVPMMDSVEKALLAMGVSLSQVRAERFNMV